MQPLHELHVQRLQPGGQEEDGFIALPPGSSPITSNPFDYTLIFDSFPLGTECDTAEATGKVVYLLLSDIDLTI